MTRYCTQQNSQETNYEILNLTRFITGLSLEVIVDVDTSVLRKAKINTKLVFEYHDTSTVYHHLLGRYYILLCTECV